MTTPMNQNNSREELIKELRMVANMINMGEKIRWGQETTLMDKAADMLETFHQELQKAREEATTQLDKILISMSWQERNETSEAIRVLAEIRESLKSYQSDLDQNKK